MNIAVDIDGVCCDFPRSFLSYINIRNNLNVSYSDITNWNWWTLGVGITEEMFNTAFTEFTTNRMWQDINIYPEVKNVLCALSEIGGSIYYITDRPKHARRSTLKFVLKHGLPIDSIVFCNHENKVRIAKELSVDFVIEDKPSTVQSFLREGMSAFIVNQPYNREYSFDVPDELFLIRCDNLRDVYRYVWERLNG